MSAVGGLRLRISTPTRVVVDIDGVASLRAEDPSGRFGLRPGHADLLTVLGDSVVDWTLADGSRGCCAVGKGVLTVRGGREVGIATRDAQPGTDMPALERQVVAAARERALAEREARLQSTQLHVQAVRRLVELLRPDDRMPS